MTLADAATAIGRSPGTLRNILNGCAVQQRTRQLLTDLLGVQIFPGVLPKPQFIELKLPACTQIILPTAAAAEALSAVLQSSAQLQGNSLTATQEVFVRVAAPVRRPRIEQTTGNET